MIMNKEAIKSLANQGFTLKSLTVKSVSLSKKDTWTSAAISVAEDVTMYRFDEYGDVTLSNKGHVIFTSMFALIAALKEIPEVNLLGKKLEDEEEVLSLLLTGATIKVYQKVVLAGEPFVNPFKEIDAEFINDHDWVCSMVTSVELGDLGAELLNEFIVEQRKALVEHLLKKKVEKKRRVFKTRVLEDTNGDGSDDGSDDGNTENNS
jgi:hypothetical protein